MGVLYTGERDISNRETDRFVKVNSCGVQNNSGYDFTLSRKQGRKDYHILFLSEGSCQLRYEGEETVLRSGDAALYLPGQEQWYFYRKNCPVQTFWLHFAGEAVPEILEELSLRGGVCRGCDTPVIRSIFMNLIVECNLRRPYSGVAGNGLLLSLLANLARCNAGVEASAGALDHVLQQMHAEYNRPAGQADYAALCHMSKSRFTAVFRQRMGTSPYHYILQLRIAQAKALLTDSDMSVASVADACGFVDALYFSRLFRRRTGMSPSAFRKAFSGRNCAEP